MLYSFWSIFGAVFVWLTVAGYFAIISSGLGIIGFFLAISIANVATAIWFLSIISAKD